MRGTVANTLAGKGSFLGSEGRRGLLVLNSCGVFGVPGGGAFIEAAHMTCRYNERLKAYYDRKVIQTNTRLATKALSNKLARICYYIIRDQVPYSEGLSTQ